MNNITIDTLNFVPYIKSEEVLKSIKKSSEKINNLYKDIATKENHPIFISILNGAFMYTSDLMKEINFSCEIEFIKVSSYHKTESKGGIESIIGLKSNIENRDIIILDDIIDSGLTMKTIVETFAKQSPRSIRIGALIFKPGNCKMDLKVDFPCITMEESNFIVGYGLDYQGIGRNLKDIYILEK